MRHVYLIRHEKPDFTNGKVFIGSTDIPLGKEGKEALIKLKDRFSGITLTAVYSSPLLRALETARALGEPTVVNDLREIDLGDWEGLTKDEVKRRWPDVFEARGVNPDNTPAPNGETFYQVIERAKKAFFKVLNESTGDVAVVAHSMVNRLLIADFIGVPLKAALSIYQPYGYVNEIEWDSGVFRTNSKVNFIENF